MAGGFIIFFVLFAFGSLIPENEANNSILIPVPDNVKIQAVKGRKCLNVLWDRPCDRDDCKVTLKIKLQTGGSSVETALSSYKPAVTNNNASYIQCIYDSSGGENVSCCNSINSGAHLISGFQVYFWTHEKIGFHIEICVNTSCTSRPYYYNFILPWRNPCFFDRPCQNSGVCNARVDAYNCTCRSEWIGYNCTNPKGYTYHAKKCLDYSSSTDVKHHMKTLAECRSACEMQLSFPRCKSFEFEKMSSGNHGNCTLRDSNTLFHKVVACDADLYESKSLLTGGSGPTVAIVTLHLFVMLLASIFLSQF